MAALLVGGLIAFTAPVWRGLILGLAAATKFGPLALAPMFAAGDGERRWRNAAIFSAVFLVVWAAVLLPLLPSGGFSEFYDRTFGYQASRGSPFSIWGLEPSLEPLQTLTRIFPVLLGLALFFFPRRRSPLQVAVARGRGPDRNPGRLRALVLLLHPLVDAVRPDQLVRLPGADRERSRTAGPGVSGRRLRSVRSSPSCGELTTSSSPGCNQMRGSRVEPTPAGVPVETMSPGTSVISVER